MASRGRKHGVQTVVKHDSGRIVIGKPLKAAFNRDRLLNGYSLRLHADNLWHFSDVWSRWNTDGRRTWRWVSYEELSRLPPLDVHPGERVKVEFEQSDNGDGLIGYVVLVPNDEIVESEMERWLAEEHRKDLDALKRLAKYSQTAS